MDVAVPLQLRGQLTAGFFTVLKHYQNPFPVQQAETQVKTDCPLLGPRTSLPNDAARDTDSDQEHTQQYQDRDQPPEVAMLSCCFLVPVNVPRHIELVGVTQHGNPPL